MFYDLLVTVRETGRKKKGEIFYILEVE